MIYPLKMVIFQSYGDVYQRVTSENFIENLWASQSCRDGFPKDNSFLLCHILFASFRTCWVFTCLDNIHCSYSFNSIFWNSSRNNLGTAILLVKLGWWTRESSDIRTMYSLSTSSKIHRTPAWSKRDVHGRRLQWQRVPRKVLTSEGCGTPPGGTLRNWCTALAGGLKCCCFLSWDGQSEMSHVMSYIMSWQVDKSTLPPMLLLSSSSRSYMPMHDGLHSDLVQTHTHTPNTETESGSIDWIVFDNVWTMWVDMILLDLICLDLFRFLL